MARRFFVTGGAGYVGSHVVDALVRNGDEVVVYDNLQQGHRAAVPTSVSLIEADLADTARLSYALRGGSFDAVIHLAANVQVGESMNDPFLYLGDNVTHTVNLLRATTSAGIEKFIFSSTAALFGGGSSEPITEDEPMAPGSPYAESKWIIERILHWAERVFGLRTACLRFFNAAGAHPEGHLGEDHNPETHLIPNVLDVALGRRPFVEIFGDDYPTPDGTCVRDYIHVWDLAHAHLRVLDVLDHRSCRYNIGNGTGYSVREIINLVESVTGVPIPAQISPRRFGDLPTLVASSALLRKETGWAPRFPELEEIIQSAWQWRRNHPDGFGDPGVHAVG